MSSAPIYSDKNYNAVAKITGGSFGFVNPYVSFDHKLGDHNSIKASANFSRADGNYPYTLTNGTLKTEESFLLHYILQYLQKVSLAIKIQLPMKSFLYSYAIHYKI